jgi:Big-like domain-containing protein
MRLFRLVLVGLILTVAGCSSKPSTIDVAQKKVKIYGLERGQRLTVRVLDRKGRPVEKAVPTFTSSKADVATVDSGGRVVAKSEGKSVVTVAFGKLSTQVPVEIVDIKTIEVVPASVQLIGPAGTQFPLQATPKNSKDKSVEAKAEWSSPKPAIATVSPDGVVTSVAPGVVTLVAKIGDVESGCEVRVAVRDVARLEIRPATAIVKAGDNQQFEVLGYAPDGKSIEGLNAVFQSSDASVAHVNPAGVATGVAAGAATIRASIGPVKAEATLIVN